MCDSNQLYQLMYSIMKILFFYFLFKYVNQFFWLFILKVDKYYQFFTLFIIIGNCFLKK